MHRHAIAQLSNTCHRLGQVLALQRTVEKREHMLGFAAYEFRILFVWETTFLSLHKYLYVYVSLSFFLSLSLYIYIYIYKLIRLFIFVYIHIPIYIYTYICIYIYICVYKYNIYIEEEIHLWQFPNTGYQILATRFWLPDPGYQILATYEY